MYRLLTGAAALCCLLASPAAALTYEVSLPTLVGGPEQITVTGTITTDGTLGEIDQDSITDWSLNFVGTDGLNETMTSTSSSWGEPELYAWGLLATPEALYISEDLGGYFQVGYFDDTYSSEFFLQFSSDQFLLTVSDTEALIYIFAFADAPANPVTPGDTLLAEAQVSAVPLPAAAGLLGAALAGLGLFTRRRVA
ncbi:VPLPA-CTERM sorting domain-containing protein [uncultured Albimonas sp.]|uniref:VPLPA-CTERM sorting domain-containing protein n=1 Tax=uncultured Albimonas sp. TaxID=1331701 RepID=UPI0030EB51C0|tara:strand:+ start:1744 stop:2331 length:588 start_codon:yes stop_codon:yes gene_type:complete